MISQRMDAVVEDRVGEHDGREDDCDEHDPSCEELEDLYQRSMQEASENVEEQFQPLHREAASSLNQSG